MVPEMGQEALSLLSRRLNSPALVQVLRCDLLERRRSLLEALLFLALFLAVQALGMILSSRLEDSLLMKKQKRRLFTC